MEREEICKYKESATEFVFNSKRVIYHTTECGFTYKAEHDIEDNPCPYCDRQIRIHK
jgi:rubrerythrin